MFSSEARDAIGLGSSLAENAKFAGIVNVVAYSTFCLFYYPAMIWLKLKEIRESSDCIKKGDVTGAAAQCGVDFGVHFFLVDMPCHVIGGILQTGLTTLGMYCGLFSLKGLDTVTTFMSQVLADAIFTPLEGPIWRKSGSAIESLKSTGNGVVLGIKTAVRRSRHSHMDILPPPLDPEPTNRDDVELDATTPEVRG